MGQEATEMVDGEIRAEDHVKLVIRIANREYSRRRRIPFTPDDLVGYGVIGLIQGVAKVNAGEYDPNQSRLSTYLGAWIRASIRGSIYDLTPLVRVPRYHRGSTAAIKSRERYGSDADRARSAAYLGSTFAEAIPVSDACVAAEADRNDEACWVHERIGSLPAREAAILRLRYGLDGDEPLLQREVGDRLGLTRQRIHQIESKALARLRSMVGEAA